MATANDAPTPDEDALVRVGERFGRVVRLSVADIRQFATLIGDLNPGHHDEAAAAAGPFGGLIASGPQTASLMQGCFATHFTRADDGLARFALGMQFEVFFRAPVRPDDDIEIAWETTSRDWKPARRAWIVQARGHAHSARHGRLIDMTGVGFMQLAAHAIQRNA